MACSAAGEVARAERMSALGSARNSERYPLAVYVLGFNCNVYNSAACLLKDGDLVAAAQEERFTREKNTGDFPFYSIRYCLSEAGIGIEQVDHASFHWRPFHHLPRRLMQIASGLPHSLRFYDSHAGRFWQMVTAPDILRRHFPSLPGKPSPRFHRVHHHICHGSSAYFCSGFDEAALLTVDGSGEMASSTLGVGSGNSVRLLQETFFPHSLGYLYVALTHYLGFRPDSDEYKVMALASYGTAALKEAFAPIVRMEPGGRYQLDLSYMAFHKGIRDPWVSPKFIATFGPPRKIGEPIEQRHKDLAHALQKRFEEVVLHMALEAHLLTGSKRLCYAGGSALNSVLNTRLLTETPFKEVYIQPAANDAGTAIGSAMYTYHSTLGYPRGGGMEHAYLGPAYSDQACADALEHAGLQGRKLEREPLLEETARLLESGAVVGWMQGRMEMGPRALGNRSILADPRRADMKEIINEKVKHREGFRPFAPSVPEEVASQFFEMDRPSPYMLFVHPIRPDKLDVIPAVAHVDGTARVQTVRQDVNPLYYDLIRRFEHRTGVPVILNTSFNVMGEPIVCSPEDAVRCYLSTGIDALVLGPYVVTKS